MCSLNLGDAVGRTRDRTQPGKMAMTWPWSFMQWFARIWPAAYDYWWQENLPSGRSGEVVIPDHICLTNLFLDGGSRGLERF